MLKFARYSFYYNLEMEAVGKILLTAFVTGLFLNLF